MADSGNDRLIAWNRELQAAHRRLRAAWQVARDSLDVGDVEAARRDLQVYCLGFCAALAGHHESEDTALFPELAARHPELEPTLANLAQDHQMMATLLVDFDRAVTAGSPPAELVLHLEGLAAIMDSHFGYEERRLLDTLAGLELDADPCTVLGPL